MVSYAVPKVEYNPNLKNKLKLPIKRTVVIITYACFHTLFYKGIQSKFVNFKLHRINWSSTHTLLFPGRHSVHPGWCFSHFDYMGVLGANCNVMTVSQPSFSVLCKPDIMSSFCRGWSLHEKVTLLILCFLHCSRWVNVISLEPCKLLGKSADSEDESFNLGSVNEFSGGFLVFSFIVRIISVFLSVQH